MLQSTEAEAGFHPRFDAVSKTYRYKIYRKPWGQTFWRNYAYLCTEELDVEAMGQAARRLEGTHDFRSFCASGSSVKNFERTVLSCRLVEAEPFCIWTLPPMAFCITWYALLWEPYWKWGAAAWLLRIWTGF